MTLIRDVGYTPWVPVTTWTANVNVSGAYRYDRQEKTLGLICNLECTGAPSPATQLQVNLPLGLAIDATRLKAQTSRAELGLGLVYDSSLGIYYIARPVPVGGGDRLVLVVHAVAAGRVVADGGVSTSIPMTFAAGDLVEFFVGKLPVVP